MEIKRNTAKGDDDEPCFAFATASGQGRAGASHVEGHPERAEKLVARWPEKYSRAVLIASPVWLYQIWAFIVPGLTRRERWYAIGFLGAAVPLFFAGIFALAIGYTLLCQHL